MFRYCVSIKGFDRYFINCTVGVIYDKNRSFGIEMHAWLQVVGPIQIECFPEPQILHIENLAKRFQTHQN